MDRPINIFLGIIFLSFIWIVPLSSQSALEGMWATGEENTIIQTYEKDGAWYGKIISSDNPKAKLGSDILRGFKQDGDVWKGKLYAAKRDKLMDAEMVPSDDNLNITVFAGFFEKKLEWKRE